jgi:hypothetical protein
LSIVWQQSEPHPAILVLPPAAVSLDEAHAAIEQWEFYSGKTLDSSQRLVVEVMMATTEAGRWAARSTGREMSRQNGKGDEIEVVELWGLTQRAEAIMHTAHQLTTVAGAHERMTGLLGHRDFRPKVGKILNGIGQQKIEMVNGGVIAYATRTNGGGRGLDDISRLVIDEAQHAQPEQLASSTPILLANPNPQMNSAGTAGILKVSKWWWSVRKRALGETPGDFGYVGHTAEVVTLDADGFAVQQPVDVEDRKLWFFANPALGAGRGEVEFYEEQLSTLGAELFAREHLGVWDADPAAASNKSDLPIDPDRWQSLARVNVDYEMSTVSLACVVAYDRSWTSIVAVGTSSDGFEQAKVVAMQPGTAWAPARAVELSTELGGVSVAMVKDEPLADAVALLGGTVVQTSGADQARSSQKLIDACSGDAPTFRHRGEPALTKALEVAVTKPYGDGNTDFSSRLSPGDISPLKALTLAFGRLGAAAETPDPANNVW